MAEYPAAPFPPAPDPADLYPAVHGPGYPAGRSRQPASRSRGVRGGLLITASFLAVLVAVALILFVALPR